MHHQELPTAVQHQAPLTWVVLDNRGLGWIRFGQKRLERALQANAAGRPAVVAFAVDGEAHPEGFHAYYALKEG